MGAGSHRRTRRAGRATAPDFRDLDILVVVGVLQVGREVLPCRAGWPWGSWFPPQGLETGGADLGQERTALLERRPARAALPRTGDGMQLSLTLASAARSLATA